ncbi:MAG: DNA helicase Pif1 like protein, partial [Benniella sp.]
MAQANLGHLNPNQRATFERIVSSIMGTIPQRLFFIDGPGGTGKSFLYDTLHGYLLGQLEKRVIVVASSGIAALILYRGRTAHSTFKIPIPISQESTCPI